MAHPLDDSNRPEPADRPLIGVTGPARGGHAAWMAVRFALWLAGARAVRITPDEPRTLGETPLLDGLVLTGGDDIEPRRYGERATRRMTIDPPRDALELDLAGEARRLRRPTLGICRGMQVLAIASGGELVEHIEPEARAHHNPLPFWRARLEPDSALAALLDRGALPINKIHHQAVARAGAGLHVAARDDDGLIQAVEAEDHPFFVGVQWHPEYLQYLAPHRRLVGAFVRAARGFDPIAEATAAGVTR